MHTRRKIIAGLGSTAIVFASTSLAQQTGKVWRIGILDFGFLKVSDDSNFAAIVEGLRELGYIEGKNLSLERRFAEGNKERLNEHVAEFVTKKVDLLLTVGSEVNRAVKNSNTNIPVVVIATSDPVKDGLAVSLSRPGGNFTGMTNGQVDIVQKLVELLLVAQPKIKRIALVTTTSSLSSAAQLSKIEAAADSLNKKIIPISVNSPEEIEPGFATMKRERIDAIIIHGNAFLYSQRDPISQLAIKNRLPLIASYTPVTEAGGLMSYAPDFLGNSRRVGIFADKIFKGTKPGDIPFEQPSRYYLAVNRKTAKTLGIKLDGELLARIDQMIE